MDLKITTWEQVLTYLHKQLSGVFLLPLHFDVLVELMYEQVFISNKCLSNSTKNIFTLTNQPTVIYKISLD